MSGGPRHDEHSIRHAATFRRRLADVEHEISELKKQIRALPGGDVRIVALHLELRAARARRSRLRNAAKVVRPNGQAGSVDWFIVTVAAVFGVAVVIMLILLDDVEPPDVERVDAKAAPARALDDTTTTTATTLEVLAERLADHQKAARPTTTTSVDVAADGIEAQIAAGFAQFGADVADQAVDVALCESNLDPAEIGDAGERGLFQLHPVHQPWIDELGFGWSRMWEVGPNIAAAAHLYADEGWGPWTCQP